MKHCKHEITYQTSGCAMEGIYILEWCPKCCMAWCAKGLRGKPRAKRKVKK